MSNTVKVVVAIHGIGSQLRCATVQSVATRFANDFSPPLPILPLGHFHVPDAANVDIKQLKANTWDSNDPRENIYFAEVYWADIPKKVVDAADTLEESKAWGRSVVSRAQDTYRSQVLANCEGDLRSEDFSRAAGVVDEIVESVNVMEKLLAALDRAGIFKFEIAALLRDYIGDVQIFADFSYYRDYIVARFHSVMESLDAEISRKFPGANVQIHVVAHSEGTVVAFMGLLMALSGKCALHPEVKRTRNPSPDWIKHVHGFMTLGSPIDKHLVLWPHLWEGLQQVAPVSNGQIKWRNYFDFGDPIGFKLDTAEQWIKDQGHSFPAFEFDTTQHDFGFSRYLLPGKAHVDYWKDAKVFRHFIQDVVLGEKAVPPQSSTIKGVFSTVVPYALSLALHAAGVYLLYKAAATYLVQDHVSTAATFANVAMLSLLLMGITFAARIPRLTNPRRLLWPVAGLAGFSLLAWPLWHWGPMQPTLSSDLLGTTVLRWSNLDMSAAQAGIAALIAMALLVALTGWLVPRSQIHLAKKLLLWTGTACAALLIALKLQQPAPTARDAVAEAATRASLAASEAVAAVQALPLTEAGPVVEAVRTAARAAEAAASAAQATTARPEAPLWPVVLALMVFLYAWWLGMLVFDLAFIWHRYIRFSVAQDALCHWRLGKDLPLTLAIGGRS